MNLSKTLEMNTAFNLLANATVASLGLSAGASLMEAIALVRIWRAMPPDAFLQWFRLGEPRLAAFFGPVQVASLLLALLCALASAAARRNGARAWAVAAVLSLGVLALFFIYFSEVNASFVARSISVDAVPAELARWERWQWARTALGLGALLAGLFALRSPEALVASAHARASHDQQRRADLGRT